MRARYYSDQVFLRDFVWPLASNNVITSSFCLASLHCSKKKEAKKYNPKEHKKDCPVRATYQQLMPRAVVKIIAHTDNHTR
jgi:hypothetical protein